MVNVEWLLAHIHPDDISVTRVDVDRDGPESWLLQLRVQWRQAAPESTAPRHQAIIITVRLIEVDGWAA